MEDETSTTTTAVEATSEPTTTAAVANDETAVETTQTVNETTINEPENNETSTTVVVTTIGSSDSTGAADLTSGSDEAMQLGTSSIEAPANTTLDAAPIGIESSEQQQQPTTTTITSEEQPQQQQAIEIDPSIMETTNNLIEQIEKGGGSESGGGTSSMEVVESTTTTNVQESTSQVAISLDPNNPDNVMLLLGGATSTETVVVAATVPATSDGQQALAATAAANDSGAGLGDDDSTLHEDDLGLNEDNSLKDIDDSLALSPNGLGGSSASLMLNGSNVSTHTFRKTEWDVKKLENYVRQSFGDQTPMENMEPALMNRYLKSFFELAKKSDGMDYEPESLIGFMNSFERYLKTKNYSESLLRSETFKESRTVLKKKRELVRSIGKLIRTKTKDTCYLLQFHRNLLKEKGLLNRDNPDCLLAEIYLNNMIYFGEFLKEDKAWRGNLNLVWGDLVLDRDPTNGVEFLTLATYAKKSSRSHNSTPGQPRSNTRTKTGTQTSKLRAAVAAAAASPVTGPETPTRLSTGGGGGGIGGGGGAGGEMASPRVYARQPLLYCPIEAYKIYRARRPNNCLERDSPFYLAPLFKSKNQSKCWYKALAMSCQRLDALFYCLFKKAGVDLTSLASMSQQQQQEVLAAAAAMDPSTPRLSGYDAASIAPPVTPSSGSRRQPKSDRSKRQNAATIAQQQQQQPQQQLHHHHHQHATEVIVSAGGELLTATPGGGYKHLTDTTNTYAVHQPSGHIVAYYPTGTQTPAGHHIITTVPAQVQVQVQIQVQLPQHQKQHQHHSNQLQAVAAVAAAAAAQQQQQTLVVDPSQQTITFG